MTCSNCKESAGFVGYRLKTIVCLVGETRLSRPYYHCKHCGAGHLPWDQILRLSAHLTPGAQEVSTLAGTMESFGKAADWSLRKLAGMRLSESTVERITEDSGERLGKLSAKGVVFGPKVVWKWNKDAEGKTCAYVSVDATGIMMQGPDGSKADGRMVYVGMVYNPQPRALEDDKLSKPCDQVRYLAGLYTLEELGSQMRRQAGQVGMDLAEQWIALTDGGNGLEHFIDVNFPLAIKILDFRHASEYLADFAKAYRPAETERLLGSWCHIMKHKGGAAILKLLEGLDRKKMSMKARAEHDHVCNYIRNNVHRMDYPAYLRRGWQIATGSVESACKTVVNQRLGMGGMRWGEFGSDNVAHLRALYRSDPDQWDAFWSYTNVA